MELFSLAFIIFILICFIIHEITGKYCGKYQWVVRLAASLCFYVFLAKIRVIFLLISAFTVWYGAVFIEKTVERGKELRGAQGLSREDKKQIKAKTLRQKRFILWSTIAINLGILGFVKYVLPSVSTGIVLPLGISFYTFQALAYLIDVYGEKYEPQDNFAKFLLYVSWFPQLIQGPINRYNQMNTSLYSVNHLSWDKWKMAMLIFLFGAIKRYSVGDALDPAVTAILGGDSANLPGCVLLFGALLYAIEQYANFSGGIDMVMAVSMIFGVEMIENFRQPYFSKSLSEFWHRWHISLGNWMRDYVFYPFAMLKPVQKLTKVTGDKFGKHFGRAVTGGIGNLLVFALVGIWHGPELHFLAWGLYNGIIIALSDMCSPLFKKMKTGLNISDDSKPFMVFQIVRTFTIVVFAGYFDIVRSVSIGLACFKNTFLNFDIASFGGFFAGMIDDGTLTYRAILIICTALIMLIINSVMKERGRKPRDIMFRRSTAVRWGMVYAMIFFLLYSFSALNGDGGFMYAAF